MKITAIFLLALAIILFTLTMWGGGGGYLVVEIEGVKALTYEKYPQEFHRLLAMLGNNSVRGTVYQPEISGSLTDYVIYEYTLLFKNSGILPAQMLEAQIVPIKGDILCYSQQEAHGQDVNHEINVSPGKETRLLCYLLTTKDLHFIRDIQTSYYIWGKSYHLTVRYI